MCGICKEPILDDELTKAWKGVEGYVTPRGAKAMVGMKPNGKLAHPQCIVRVRHRLVTEQQESLL